MRSRKRPLYLTIAFAAGAGSKQPSRTAQHPATAGRHLRTAWKGGSVGSLELPLNVLRNPAPVADLEALSLSPLPNVRAVLAVSDRPAPRGDSSPGHFPGVRHELRGHLVQAPAVLRAQVDLKALSVQTDQAGLCVFRAAPMSQVTVTAICCAIFPAPVVRIASR